MYKFRKRLAFAAQATLTGIMVFGFLSLFLNVIEAVAILFAKYLNTVPNKLSRTVPQTKITSITPSAIAGFVAFKSLSIAEG